jgi:hypothetical protein
LVSGDSYGNYGGSQVLFYSPSFFEDLKC